MSLLTRDQVEMVEVAIDISEKRYSPANLGMVREITDEVRALVGQLFAEHGTHNQKTHGREGGGGNFPDSLDELKPVKKLGGSTGAMLMKDGEGRQFVVKRGSSPGHLESEMAADSMYEALGVPVPAHKRFTGPKGEPVKVAEHIEGETLDKIRAKSPQKADEIYRQVGKNFAADALLGNWDVAGLEFDNILVNSNGRAFRIDNGGALTYRAQGKPKGAAFGDKVGETNTLRDKKMNPSSAEVFKHVTKEGTKSQVATIDSKRKELLAVTPPELRKRIGARLDDMKKQYGVGLKESAAADLQEHLPGKHSQKTHGSGGSAEDVKVGSTVVYGKQNPTEFNVTGITGGGTVTFANGSNEFTLNKYKVQKALDEGKLSLKDDATAAAPKPAAVPLSPGVGMAAMPQPKSAPVPEKGAGELGYSMKGKSFSQAKKDAVAAGIKPPSYYSWNKAQTSGSSSGGALPKTTPHGTDFKQGGYTGAALKTNGPVVGPPGAQTVGKVSNKSEAVPANGIQNGHSVLKAPLSFQERDALQAYSGSSHGAINDGLRKPPPKPPAQLVSAMDSGLRKSVLSKDTTVYRGMKADDAFLAQLKPGRTIVDKGYASTSTSIKVARDFAGSGYGTKAVVFHVSAKAGQRALDMKDLSYHENEKEILLPRGSAFKITKVVPYQSFVGHTEVHVEVV